MSEKYDLEERTAQLGENIIEFCTGMQQNEISKPIIKQLIRSGTSIGANYAEANGASSKKDFRHKIHICKKETQETKHWIRMITKCVSGREIEAKALWKECQELNLIFQKITTSLRQNKPKNEN